MAFGFVNSIWLFLLLIFCIESFADQTSWNGSNQNQKITRNLALFANEDEVDPPLSSDRTITDPIKAIKTSQGTANRTDDKQLNFGTRSTPMTVPLVGNGAKNGQHFGTKKAPSQRLRSIFSWVSKFNQNGHIMKLYQKLKNTPGGWGQLIRKMYAEMLSAKKLGAGDSKPLRENCHKALQLIGEGRAVQRVDVQKIKPFHDFWTLLKNSALSLVTLFKGTLKTKNGRESDRKMKRENILRALKTFSTEDNSFFLRMVRKNGKTNETHKDQKRRRQKRLAPLIIFGIIIGGLLVIAFLSEWVKAGF